MMDSAGGDVDEGPDDLAPDECWLRLDDSGIWRCRRSHRPPPGGHAVIVTRDAARQVLGLPGRQV